MTMKKSLSIHSLLLAVLLIFAAGCTTNNGDIGPYYGSWNIEKITIDGVEQTSWKSDGTWTVWSFQNDIIEVMRGDALQDTEKRYGTWEQKGDMLELNFTHHDDKFSDENYMYGAPTWIYMTTGIINSLHIDNISSKNMSLTLTDPEGRKIVYTLRKLS